MLSAYWYLPVLFCYSITVFINNFLWKRSKTLCLAADAVIAAMLFLVLYKCKIRFAYSLAFYFVAYLVPFMFGVFYNSYKDRMPKVAYFVCLCVVFFVSPLFDGFVHHSVYMHFLKNVIGISVTLLLLELFRQFNYENKYTRAVCFVGKNTMPIYLFHFYMLTVYCQHGEIIDLLPNMIIALLILLASIFLGKLISLSPLLSFLVLGKIPERMRKYFY